MFYNSKQSPPPKFLSETFCKHLVLRDNVFYDQKFEQVIYYKTNDLTALLDY